MKTHPAVRLIAFALLLLVIPAALTTTTSAQIGVGISVRIGPPALPVYEQPLCPGPGYLWTPGYWAWSDDAGYYWVPGTWVEAPEVGLFWTPGYWGWNDGVYAWNEGYWGPEIGFYGGINYGFGYGGEGFYGGEWRGGAFFYNTAVMRVDETRITNVYVNRTVIVNNESHVAFNGGQGGVERRPNAREEAYARQPHTRPVAAQVQHVRAGESQPSVVRLGKSWCACSGGHCQTWRIQGKRRGTRQGCRSALLHPCHIAKGSARLGWETGGSQDERSQGQQSYRRAACREVASGKRTAG